MPPIVLSYLHALPGFLVLLIVLLGHVSLICTSLAALTRFVNAMAKSPKAEALAVLLDRGGIALKAAQAKTETIAKQVTTVETTLTTAAPAPPPAVDAPAPNAKGGES